MEILYLQSKPKINLLILKVHQVHPYYHVILITEYDLLYINYQERIYYNLMSSTIY